MKRKICVISGTRADYGIWYPVMQAIQSSETLELYLMATSMHLMKEFGLTVKEIERDGFAIYKRIDVSYADDTGAAMIDSLGRALAAFSKIFSKLRPDIVFVLGDRGEMLMAAIAANYLNIPVAHLHGGEVSGHVDGALRHAITKLSHIHFPATKKSGMRLIKLGEETWRVFVSGAPALDRILNEKLPADKDLIKKYKINMSEPLLILVQHPVMTEQDKAAEQIRISLETIKNLGHQTMIIYPNADAGGRRMIEVIREYEGKGKFRSMVSMPHMDYLGLLKIASVLIGNSSSGIIESPSFKIPAVNIGSRQAGRERSMNVIDVPPKKNAILKAIKKALCDEKFKQRVKRCKNPYGDGRASQRIVDILGKVKLSDRLLQKQMTY